MLKKFLIALFVLFVIFLIWLYFNASNHFIFDPYIDTIFSEGFSEEKFHQVNSGMSKDEVLALLGEPLSRDYWGNNPKCWQYSTDGKVWPYADFSYYLFQICFNDRGLVEYKTAFEFFN